ncbi:hypothetical protein N7G274_006325 [Stereocaulon virgatum]|uniref:Retrotransposon gag domain-containing protein n=1 Tax=Stereocaulon virgatum TaxID=373712 RepID=A0ABR4A4M7_9LECA
MRTRFSGGTTDVRRWLSSLKYEGPPFQTPGDHFECINSLLSGDAALWADTHPRVKSILRKKNPEDITDADVKTFQTALRARFPPNQLKSGYNSLAKLPVKAFGQHAGEDLEAYYQRAIAYMYEQGGVDLDEAPLTSHEKKGLRTAIKAYVLGLEDEGTVLGLQRDFEVDRELSLRAIHENAKERHWAQERRRKCEQTDTSIFAPRPNTGHTSMPEKRGSLLPNNSTFPGPRPPSGTGHQGSRSGAGGPSGNKSTNDAPPARTIDSPFGDFSRGQEITKDIKTSNRAKAGPRLTDSFRDKVQELNERGCPEPIKKLLRDIYTTRGVDLVNNPPTAPQDGSTSRPGNSHHGGPPPQQPRPHFAYAAPHEAAKPLLQSKPNTELSREELLQRAIAEEAARRVENVPNPGVAAQDRLREQPNPVLTPEPYATIHARAGERPYFGNGSMTGAGHNFGGPGGFGRLGIGTPYDMPLPNNQWVPNRGNASTDAGGPTAQPPAGRPPNYFPPRVRSRVMQGRIEKSKLSSAHGSGTTVFNNGNTDAGRAANPAAIGNPRCTAVAVEKTHTASSSRASTLGT